MNTPLAEYHGLLSQDDNTLASTFAPTVSTARADDEMPQSTVAANPDQPSLSFPTAINVEEQELRLAQPSLEDTFHSSIDWAATRSPRLAHHNSWTRGRRDLSPPPPYRDDDVIMLPRWLRELEIILESECGLDFTRQSRFISPHSKRRIIANLRAWLDTHDLDLAYQSRFGYRPGWFNAHRSSSQGPLDEQHYLRRGRINRYFDERRRHRRLPQTAGRSALSFSTT